MNDSRLQTQFPFNDRQRRIHRRLALIGPGAPGLYEDACHLIAAPDDVHAAALLVAHLLRELESSLLAVLVPSGFEMADSLDPNSASVDRVLNFLLEMGISESATAGSKLLEHVRGEGGQKSKIKAVLADLGLTEDPIAMSWARFPDDRPWVKWVHRHALTELRPLDDQFRRNCEDFEAILDRVLEAFELRYAEALRTLANMATKPCPSPDDLFRIKNNLPNNLVAQSHFFDALYSAEWIDPLRREGFFKRPPEPVLIEVGEETLIQTAVWPQSTFLVRMSRAGVNPKAVILAARDIPFTNNGIVREDLVAVALALDINLAPELIQSIEEWFEAGPRNTPVIEIGELMARLATGGQHDPALRLARALLMLEPEEIPPMPRLEGEGFIEFPPEPRARIDRRDFVEILNDQFPVLVAATGIEAIKLLCHALDSAIAMGSGSSRSNSTFDASQIWLPAIGAEDISEMLDERAALGEALRRAAERYAELNPENNLPPVMELLAQFRWDIFRRVEIYFARLFPNALPDFVNARLRDIAAIDNPAIWLEFRQLARDRFGTLPQPDQQAILSWIAKGPDEKIILSRMVGRGNQNPTGDEVSGAILRWQWQRLALFRNHLSGEWRVRYEELASEFGQVDDEPRKRAYANWSAPASPKTPIELAAMSDDELVDILSNWEPSGALFEPSPGGLVRALASIVRMDPLRFAGVAVRSENLEPTYIRGLFEGFTEALEHGQSFPWAPVLDLGCKVVQKPRGTAEREDYLARDGSFGPARLQLARLMQMGLSLRSPSLIPYELREKAWSILESIMDDPDPTPESDQRPEGVYDQPWQLVSTAVRRAALFAIVDYAVWVRSGIFQGAYSDVSSWQGFDSVPEVTRVLDDHLDPAIDPSPTVRAVYGWLLPLLADLDPSWVRSSLDRLFPVATGLRPLCDAAWGAYLAWGQNDLPRLFELLRDQYIRALDGLHDEWAHRAWSGSSSPARLLAQHLMRLYKIGFLDFEENGLLDNFYAKAPASIRAHAMDMAAFKLPAPLDDEVSARLVRLWDLRIQTAEMAPSELHDEFATEISTFGRWFESGAFETTWSIEQLKRAIKFAGCIQSRGFVLRRLASVAVEMPKAAVDALLTLVELDPDRSAMTRALRYEEAILETALAAGDDELLETVERVARLLVAQGDRTFLRFVAPRPGD